MDGWIKLHRKLMHSETFSRLTAIQKLIAIYIILNANHNDGVWYDKYKNIEVNIKRGQLITSRNKIANEWFCNDKDVTEQKIRTCLDKLERVGFLTKESTNGYTLITVHNYSIYQGSDEKDNQHINQELTSNQPSDNQAITTNKNVKKNKNDNKNKENIKDIVSNYSSNIELIETLEAFIEFRKSIKKAMTERAVKLLLNELDKLSNDDTEKIAILNQSIMKNWHSVYPLKNNQQQEHQRTKTGRPQLTVVSSVNTPKQTITDEELAEIKALAAKFEGRA